jgi:hypothetical protein
MVTAAPRSRSRLVFVVIGGFAFGTHAIRMIFRATPLRFEFEARERVWFPPGKAGNTFRGALGAILPEAVFSPCAEGSGPSGLEDRPRPFVLRAEALDGRRFEPGERFGLDVSVFDPQLAQTFETAFEGLTRLGPQRSEVRLIHASRPGTVAIDLAATAQVDSLRIQFLTPMELKFEGATLRSPRFDALFTRVRDRVSTLCTIYQGGEPDADYRGLGERSRGIGMTGSRIANVETERRSSRTGQRHGLGGFTGEADYEGPLDEFLPWLKAAEWTGAGRYTVWGNGALRATGVSCHGIPL